MSDSTDDSVLASIKWLKALTREISRVRISQYLSVDDSLHGAQLLPVAELKESHFPVLGEHMALILISAAGLRIVFKIHFDSIGAAGWAGKIFAATPAALRVSQVAELIKECCNMTAGGLKHEFSLHGLQSGISLPLLARGFDEVFSDPEDGRRHFRDVWILGAEPRNIVCSAEFAVIEQNIFSSMRVGQILSTSSVHGEVEIL